MDRVGRSNDQTEVIPMLKLIAIVGLLVSALSASTAVEPTSTVRQPTSVTVVGAGSFTVIDAPSFTKVTIARRTVARKQYLCTAVTANLVGGSQRTCEWK